ncbi:MAG TPA: PH domain-containing protein [Rhodospirillaceae bacterium]|nr:PH domain-containing protein [Rhodospirillaceae bacterium]
MSSYIQSQLNKDESVIYSAKLHWWIYARAALLTLVGIITFMSETHIGYLLIITGILAFILSFLQVITTELAITNKRVIAKFGIIRRSTYEQQISKIDGCHLEQSIFGRILGFASIGIRGSGGVSTPIPYIAAPDLFKRRLAEQVI